MTDILDRLFDRSYDLEETLHDAHTEIERLRKALTEITNGTRGCAEDRWEQAYDIAEAATGADDA